MNNNLMKMIILIIGCIFLLSGCKEHSHTYSVLKVDPTCTEKGYIYYNCKCGYQETQEIPALGHFYENGKFSCGELETIEIYVENKELADRVFKWTIDNMYDNDRGYFYFQKHKLLTNKVPLMRWSEAFMFNALSYYLMEKIKNQ